MFRPLRYKKALLKGALVAPAVLFIHLALWPQTPFCEITKHVDMNGQPIITDGKSAPAYSGRYFRYVDEKGRIHFTNKESSVPRAYRSGVAPVDSVPDAGEGLLAGGMEMFTGERERAWVKYKGMAWIEKKWFVLRVGFTDLKGALSDLKFQLISITVLLSALVALTLLKIRPGPHRRFVVGILIVCYIQVLAAYHLKKTMGRGGDILDSLRAKQQEVSDKILQGARGDAFSQLQGLQQTNSERENLFRVILEEEGL
jgi:hypothetical protein